MIDFPVTDYPSLLKTVLSIIGSLSKDLISLSKLVEARNNAKNDAKIQSTFNVLSKLMMNITRLAHYNIPLLILETDGYFSLSAESSEYKWYRVLSAITEFNSTINGVVMCIRNDEEAFLNSGFALTEKHEILYQLAAFDSPHVDRWAIIGLLDKGPGDKIEDVREAVAMLIPMKSECEKAIKVLREFIDVKKTKKNDTIKINRSRKTI